MNMKTLPLGVSFISRRSKYLRSFSSKLKRQSIQRPLYFDYQATTPVDPRVLDKMLPLYTELYGNSHSRTHGYGWETEDLIENARDEVAKLINCLSKEVIFTSGATESNNTIIRGVCENYGNIKEGRNHIITTQIEHKCVLSTLRELELKGFKVTYLEVDRDGLLSLKDLESAIESGKTILVSVMFVNNEIGVIQSMESIGEVCRKHGVLFHSDVAQGLGKLQIDVNKWKVDFLSMSGHKIYGPKGIGAFYIRSKPRRRIKPLIFGGGQERGFRSGTLAVPLVVGFGEACRIANDEMVRDSIHVKKLYHKLYHGIQSQVPNIKLNGSSIHRCFNNLNLSFAGVEGESLLMKLQSLALSSGSACTSASLEPSYVLRAIGVDEETAHTSIRFGLGRFTTPSEIDLAVDEVVKAVSSLRNMSPIWDQINSTNSSDISGPIWT
ncbi:aminotransferase, class V family protein [Cryptosporidium muris RN66]|uniref:cysteine desulfurase n=1 Tax=Cryptosporidium muris (strain RN66) TaxID=441375 RepID=B6AD56_CRYMR|nr:aminotransferase, class V family protein [Cryptosporidium muris RN66]EEA06060.1 aminotransferase, class V family protein [Cryptosporidium muris RN66]|eukprot:XP_002140409.1 aminotransferase, class V family protein [Cryptosporidium muris RN66]